MNQLITIVILTFLPLLCQAQSYNGEAEGALIYILGLTAPVVFLIGLFLAIRYWKNPQTSISSKIGWFFAVLNALIGVLWLFLLQLLFADGIGGEGLVFLALLSFALLAFVPIGLMILGAKK